MTLISKVGLFFENKLFINTPCENELQFRLTIRSLDNWVNKHTENVDNEDFMLTKRTHYAFKISCKFNRDKVKLHSIDKYCRVFCRVLKEIAKKPNNIDIVKINAALNTEWIFTLSILSPKTHATFNINVTLWQLKYWIYTNALLSN